MDHTTNRHRRIEAIETIQVTPDLRIRIYPDYDFDQTPDTYDNDGLFLVADHRDFSVSHAGTSWRSIKKPQDAIYDEDFHDHDDGEPCNDECHRRHEVVRAWNEDYHVFLLYAYIHSGVALSLGPCISHRAIERSDAQWEAPFDPGGWDSSMLGLVFVSRKEWPDEDEAKKAAESLVEEWNDCLSGNVYGYVIERRYTIREEKRVPGAPDFHGPIEVTEFDRWEVEDSCWGFVGDYDAEGGCLAEAKSAAESMLPKQAVAAAGLAGAELKG